MVFQLNNFQPGEERFKNFFMQGSYHFKLTVKLLLFCDTDLKHKGVILSHSLVHVLYAYFSINCLHVGYSLSCDNEQIVSEDDKLLSMNH